VTGGTPGAILAGVAIREVDGVYVISSHQCWLPGNYDSERTARYAFRFPNEILEATEDVVNKGFQRPITMEDLRATKA
jgi:hypothetical protein